MNIIIAGASGFIGTELVKSLKNKHNITVLGRNTTSLKKHFPDINLITDWENLKTLDPNNYDAVINLCGHNIAASRWNEKIKAELIDSRVNSNKLLITWLTKQNAKPHFICANAIGIYGLQTDGATEELDEKSFIDLKNPTDFLSEIGIKWQESLEPAIKKGIPVTTTRFGVVLKKNQGLLKKLVPSFWLGLGSILGNGCQILSWIHIDDVIAALLFLLERPHLTGAFNLSAPKPLSQKQFSQILAKTLGRPLFLKIPAKIISLLLGEMGSCLLLHGQRVVPTRLLEEGYVFRYPDCAKALKQEFRF